MNELAVQSASDTNETIDRDALDAEFQQLVEEIDDIATQTKFNNKYLLDGSVTSKVDTSTTNSDIFTVAGVSSVQASGAAGTTYEFADVTGTGLTITRTDGSTSAIETVLLGETSSGEGTITVAGWGLNVTLGPGYTALGVNGKKITMGVFRRLIHSDRCLQMVNVWRFRSIA